MLLLVSFALAELCYLLVASTAFHGIEQGFRTILVEDASRGIKVRSNLRNIVFALVWLQFFTLSMIYSKYDIPVICAGRGHHKCIFKDSRTAWCCGQFNRGDQGLKIGQYIDGVCAWKWCNLLMGIAPKNWSLYWANLGQKIVSYIDRYCAGEGDGARKRQETRAGIQDGSYVQVNAPQFYGQVWGYINIIWNCTKVFELYTNQPIFCLMVYASFLYLTFFVWPFLLSEILPQGRHYLSSQKQEQQV